ncbi:MAG TPA: AAA family ATPase, partial [Nannocystis sp.]
GLLGRDDELAALDLALADARAGQAAVVLLHAATAGLGRSAVIDHFVAARERDAIVVLSGRCSERESLPYKGVDGLIDALARELHRRADPARLCPPHIHTLARLFPVLRRVPAIARATPGPDDGGLAPHELRQLAFEALRQLLARLAGEAPLVLVLDDLHHGDHDSAALLRELLAPPDPPPLLLIASHRGDTADSACVRALASLDLRLRRLALGPLAPADATALAQSLLAGSSRAGEAAAIAREAAGNPLFIVELCHFVRGAEAVDPLAQASSFDALLRRRIAGLDLASRALLEVVAVAAEPIDLALVAAVAGHPGDPQPTLTALRREHLLRSHRVDGRTTVEVFHDRVREALLADLAPTRAREIHRDLADALERSEAPDIERLRVHLAAAGETTRAAAYTLRAAERASTALAFERAAALYRAAREHAAPEDRPRLDILLGDTLASDGRGVEAADAYLRAADALGGTQALELLRRAGFERLRSGHIDEGIAVLQKVLASVDMRLSGSRGRALLSLAGHRVALALRGLRFHERPEAEIPPELLRRADVAWSIGASGLGMVDDIAAGEFQSLALRLALRAGEPMRICRALAGEVAFSAVGGTASLRRTTRLLHTARTLAERLDQPQAR